MIKLFLLFSTAFLTLVSAAQTVGIGTNTPHNSALLHISTGSNFQKGFLVEGVYDPSALMPDLGAGSRMMFYPGRGAFRAGRVEGAEWDNVNIGIYSVAMGRNTNASGEFSTAMGHYTSASGITATALGYSTIASAYRSTAMGGSTTASGEFSTAMGFNTSATGDNSTATGSSTIASGAYSSTMGVKTIAKGSASTVIGRYNDSILLSNQLGSPTSGTPLFIIGNGYGEGVGQRSNAMVVKMDGSVGIGTNFPIQKLDVLGNIISGSPTRNVVMGTHTTYGNNYAAWWRDGSDYTLMSTATHTYLNAPEANGNVYLRTNNITKLFVRGSDGNVGIGTETPSQKLFVVGNICYTGSSTACSDIRYKTNILPVLNALSAVLSLHPIYYNWNQEKFKDMGFTNEKQIGFSAQEIEKLFPEIVQTDARGYKAIDYSRLTPVLVEAMKEQQKEIGELKKRLEKLEKLLAK